MTRLKVMQLSSEKSWRGGEQQIAYLTTYLLSQNVDVVVCVRKGSAFSKWCNANKVTYYELGFKNGIDIRTAIAIKRISANEEVDILNSHSGKSHSLAVLAAKIGMKTPLVVHRRVDFPLKTSGFSLAKYNHKNVKAIICVSNAISNLVKEVVRDTQRVTTIYSGINPERFTRKPSTKYLHKEFGIDHNKKLIANISAITPHKDYKTFLRTAKKVTDKRNDCHFLIVGNGKNKSEIELYSNSLNLGTHVTFTGFRSDVPFIFRELSIFLITSKTEGLGTTVIDSLCNGIPIVATKAGGIPELVRDESEGFLCSVGDADCLADKVMRILNSEKLSEELSLHGIERAQFFTNDKMGGGVLKIYKDIIANLQ